MLCLLKHKTLFNGDSGSISILKICTRQSVKIYTIIKTVLHKYESHQGMITSYNLAVTLCIMKVYAFAKRYHPCTFH